MRTIKKLNNKTAMRPISQDYKVNWHGDAVASDSIIVTIGYQANTS